VGVRKNAKTHLHALFAVRVISFLLMTFEKCANDEDAVHGDLVVVAAQVLLRFNCQFCESDGKTTTHVIIISVYQSSPQWEVVIRALLSLSLLVIDNNRFCPVRSIRKDDCLCDDLGT